MEDESKPRRITRAPEPPESIVRGIGGLSLATRPRVEAAPDDDVTEWVTAAQIAAAMSRAMGHADFPNGSPSALDEVRKYAGLGEIRTRAVSWYRDGDQQPLRGIPKQFWNGGGVGFSENWHLGRFSHPVSLSQYHREQWEAFGVTFAMSDAVRAGLEFDKSAAKIATSAEVEAWADQAVSAGFKIGKAQDALDRLWPGDLARLKDREAKSAIRSALSRAGQSVSRGRPRLA